MKKFFILLISLSCFFIFSEDEKNSASLNNFEVKEGFCSNKGFGFQNGIIVKANNSKLYSLADSEVIFYSKKRKDNISYRKSSIAVFEDPGTKIRYFYKADNSNFKIDKKKISKNDEIAVFADPNNNIFIKIEDQKNNKIINPLSLINIEDSKNPFIEDIYFITDNNEYVSLVKSYTSAIKRGGRIFVKCFDRINNSYFNVSPYRIKLLIDGKELTNLTFDSLTKNKDYFSLNNKLYSDIFKDKEPFNYFLAEYSGLPGVIGFIVEIEDFKGNKTTYKRALSIILNEK